MNAPRDFLLAPSSVRPLHAILAEVCAKYRVSQMEVIGGRRDKAFVRARREFCYIARNETAASLPRIGKEINRTHWTVSHHIERHESRLAKASHE